MTTRQDLIQALATAGSLADQIKLAAELDTLDHGRTAAVRAERSLDWADTTVKETLAPRIAFERESAATDWLLDMEPVVPDRNAVIAEAAQWYGRVHEAVKADQDEFAEQAKGMAFKVAAGSMSSAQEFVDYITFLYNRHLAASGLPQVQQLVDSFEKPAPTPLPQDVFDTFQPPIHPINQGVDGTQQNSLAPGAEMAMGENNGSPMGDPSHHDWAGVNVPQNGPNVGVEDGSAVTAPSHAGPTGTPSEHDEGDEEQDYRTASLYGPPTVAIGYTGLTLNDFMDDVSGSRRPFADAPAGRGVNTTARFDPDHDGDNDATPQGDTDHDYWTADGQRIRHEGASGLPQVQQVEDSFENPAPTSLPTEVMFPLEQEWPEMTSAQFLQQGGQDTGSSHRPHTGQHKTADQWHGGDIVPAVPGGETPVGNTPATTDQKSQGGYEMGFSEGQRDARSGGRPTFSDNSSAISPYVKGYSEGFASVAPSQGPQDVPYSMGGDSGQAINAAEVAARTEKPLQNQRPELSLAASTKTGITEEQRHHAEEEGDTLPGTDKFPIRNKQDLANAKHDIGRTSEPHDKVVDYINRKADELDEPHVGEGKGDEGTKKAAFKVSASLLTKDITGDHAFAKGYKIASRWDDSRGLPPIGDTGFEAGLYAGISDNPEAQWAWTFKHQAMKLQERLEAHGQVTRAFKETHPDAVIDGFYVQAATSSDLDTMAPTSEPDPMGSTPLVGPGTTPPLRDAPGTPAAAGGPSPYNGAEPMGAPVVDDPLLTTQAPPQQQMETPVAPNMSGDSSLLRGNPATLAFRKQVQAGKLALRQKEN
jgi:hypothetical protein